MKPDNRLYGFDLQFQKSRKDNLIIRAYFLNLFFSLVMKCLGVVTSDSRLVVLI